MNCRYAAFAMSALGMGVIVLGASEASATLKPEPGVTMVTEWPDEGTGYPGYAVRNTGCTYPEDPACDVAPLAVVSAASPADDEGFEGVQLGASAVGGAAVALGGVWLSQRRHLIAS
jgi:hypothetical protein